MREHSTQSHQIADSVGVHTSNYLDSFDPRIMSIERIFHGSKERNIETWERTVAIVSAMHVGVKEARKVHTPEKTIDTRIQVAVLSLNYAVDAFFDEAPGCDIGEVSRWIPDQLISVATKKNPMAISTTEWLSNWLLTYSGDELDIHWHLAESLREGSDAKRIYRRLVKRLPEPISPKNSTIAYWNPTNNRDEFILGIDGYSRDGVRYLRKIVSDFRALRRKKFHTPFSIGKEYIVSSDSWMFSSPEKMEMLFGETMEQLSAKGLGWTGPISINTLENADNFAVNPIQRVIGSAVYALQLRDPFMVNFIALGQYPEIGSFRMPRTTFQNYHESIEA